jgi:hypothetical protein
MCMVETAHVDWHRCLQELVLGRIGSRLKSSWYFPPMQQLLQAHREDGRAEDQAATDEAAAEQAAAAAAGQAAGAVLAGVVSRDGSKLGKNDAASASSAAVICCGDKDNASRQQQQQQQRVSSRSNSCCLVAEGEGSWVAAPAAACALPDLNQQQQHVRLEQQAECAEPVQLHAGVDVYVQNGVAAAEDDIACVEVQVLLAGTADSKMRLQQHSLSNEQMSC